MPFENNNSLWLTEEDLDLSDAVESTSPHNHETKENKVYSLAQPSSLVSAEVSAEAITVASRSVPIAVPNLGHSWDSISTGASSSVHTPSTSLNLRRGSTHEDVFHTSYYAEESRGYEVKERGPLPRITEHLECFSLDEDLEDIFGWDDMHVEEEEELSPLPTLSLMRTFSRSRPSDEARAEGDTSSLLFEGEDAPVAGVTDDLLFPLDDEVVGGLRGFQ